ELHPSVAAVELREAEHVAIEPPLGLEVLDHQPHPVRPLQLHLMRSSRHGARRETTSNARGGTGSSARQVRRTGAVALRATRIVWPAPSAVRNTTSTVPLPRCVRRTGTRLSTPVIARSTRRACSAAWISTGQELRPR